MLSGCVYRMLPTTENVTLNGSRVSAVADSSGTGDSNKNAAQATAGFQPLYSASDTDFAGQPSIEFDEARGDYLQTGTWSTAMPGTCTWFVVARHTGIDSGTISFILDGLGAARQPLYVQNPNLVAGGGSAISTTGWPYPHSEAIVLVTGASGQLYVSDTTAAASGNTGTSTQAGLTIGAGQGIPAGFFFEGKIAEIVGYNRALAAAEVAQLLGYARSRYGLVIDGNVMPLGDSITLGSNGPTGGWRKILLDAHPGIYAGHGSSNDPSGYWHNGIASTTLTSWNTNFATYWAQARCREVWLTLGTNDILGGASAATALTRLGTLLTTIEAVSSPPLRIRVASITPLTGGFATPASDFNAGIAGVVASHGTAVYHDIGGRLSASYLDVDNIHPTSAGHTLLAQYWAEALGLA